MHSSVARPRRKVKDLRKLWFRWEVPALSTLYALQVSGISSAILELESQ